LAGEKWTPESRSALAAAPGVHDQMLDILRRVGSPEDY
jgi:myo-inositol-1(or 4)-monophosphatase